MTGGLALAIRLRFHNHAPQQLARGLAPYQQAANELWGNLLGGRAKKDWGRNREGVVAMGVAWGCGLVKLC